MLKKLFILFVSASIFGCGSSSDVKTTGTVGGTVASNTGTSSWGVNSTGTSSWGVSSTGTSSWGVNSTGTSSFGVASGNGATADNGGGSGITKFTSSMLNGKTMTVADDDGGLTTIDTLNTDGTWVEDGQVSGTWSVDGNGRLVLVLKSPITGSTDGTITITLISGSLPTLHASFVFVSTNGLGDSSGTVTITAN